MNLEDWKVTDDKENIREGAIELRESVSKNLYYNLFDTVNKAESQVSNGRTFWRRTCLSKLELIAGKKLSGKILEIGAGSGWCSAILSKKDEIDEIYVMDYDKYSVETLAPMVAKNLSANFDKLKFVVGSYNSIKKDDNSFDIVISVGAIHHSENLDATFSECYRVLKPGGFLIAIEHCHPNSYTINNEEEDQEKFISPERAKNLYGDANLKIKVKDNSDHNYRISEFEAAAYKARFNCLPYIFDVNGENVNDEIFKKPQPYSGFSNRTFKPYFAKNKIAPVFDNLLFICQKPDLSKENDIFKDINIKNVKIKTKRTFFQKASLKIKTLTTAK